MSSQTEDRKQPSGQALPENDAGTRKGGRKSWLVLAVTVIETT